MADWPEPDPSDVLARVLTLEALSPQPARSPEEIRQQLCTDLDPERLTLELQRHPSWVALPTDDGSAPRFLPRLAFIEHLLWLVRRWLRPACDIDEQTFAFHAARQIYGLHEAGADAGDIVLETLSEMGLAEKDEHGWSMERPRAFAAMCRRFDLTLCFQVDWDGCRSPCAMLVAADPGLDPVAGFWAGLAERETNIFKWRWLERLTLEAIGGRLHLSKERVRQIMKAAEEDKSGLRQRHMNQSFAGVLARLPSCRLVWPDSLAMTWERDLGGSVSRDALLRLLERRLYVTPIALCDGELWWLPFENDEPPSDELRWTWESEGQATPTLGESGVRLTRWEREAILNCRLTQEEAQTPCTMRDCLVHILRLLGRPSRLSTVRREAVVRYPQYAWRLRTVYGVLNRHPDVFLAGSERGVYGLRGMEALLARETPHLPIEATPPAIGAEPVATPPAPLQVAPEPPRFDAPEEDAAEAPALGAADLFDNMPNGGLVELMTAIARTARRLLDVPAPRSLCEIGVTESDYETLCAWAKGLSSKPLKVWIGDARPRISVSNGHRLSMQEGVGLLLLLVAAETGRRKAREGHLWTEARKVYSVEAESLLFVQGQPTWPHKEALQAAARALGLRHVFGREGTQEYYITTYLQFGFTRSAIQRMPEWLSGIQTSEAVQQLSSGNHGSASFRELWQALLDFRRGNVSETRAREVCSGSPWLLPSWVDDVLTAVRKRPSLSALSKEAVESGVGTPLLEAARLRWEPGHAPLFVTGIVNLEGRGLEEPGYTLRFEPHGMSAPMYRREDGGYDTPAEISLSVDAPRYRADLWDSESTYVETMVLDLWSPDEDVAAFDLPSGSPVDAWRSPMSPTRGYALLLASDLEITPRPADWRAFGKTHTLYRLTSGWSGNLRVTLDGEELWTPNLKRAKRPEREQPEWASVFFGGTREVEIGTRAPELSVPLPAGVSLDFVRLGPEPLEFRVEGERACIEPFELSPERVADGLTATFGLRRGGRRAVVRQQLPFLPTGVLRFGPGGCQALLRDADLRVRDLRNAALQLFMPPSVGDGIIETLALVVGEAYRNIEVRPFARGLLATRPVSWRTAAGTGAPLLVRRPYNTVDPRSAFQAARAVCDTGSIKNATFDEGRVVVELDRAVEPGPDHRVLLWDPWQPERTVAHDAVEADDNQWQIVTGGAPPSVAAIFYEGALIGAWGDTGRWSAALANGLAEADSRAAMRVAAMLRGLHLPLLHPEAQEAVRRFTGAYPVECLCAWMRDDGLPAGWEASAQDEAWFGVVRAMYTDWEPARNEARRLLESLADADAEDACLDVLEQVIAVDPRLAARVAAAWKDDPAVKEFGPAELSTAIRRIAGLDDDDDDAGVRAWIADRLEAAAESMQVDPKFLESLMKPVPGNEQNLDAAAANLTIALTVSPFRKGMAVHLLREI